MQMTTKRQLKQPQTQMALVYHLLHNGWKDSPTTIDLIRKHHPNYVTSREVNIF